MDRSCIIVPVKREADGPRPLGTVPSRRHGEWRALFPTLVAALWISATLTYLWDTASHARLSALILFSVTFGLGLGQLPPVKSLLRGRGPRRTDGGTD